MRIVPSVRRPGVFASAALDERDPFVRVKRGDRRHRRRPMVLEASDIHRADKVFDERDARSLRFLKIGVYTGASRQMWRSYFPRSRIFGIDITPIELDASRIAAFGGHQEDAAFLEEVLDKTGSPELVIDDGSPLGPHIIASFHMLFPRLAPGGIFIEDLHAAHQPTFRAAPRSDQSPSAPLGTVAPVVSRVAVTAGPLVGAVQPSEPVEIPRDGPGKHALDPVGTAHGSSLSSTERRARCATRRSGPYAIPERPLSATSSRR
jgi:hypothetical protein